MNLSVYKVIKCLSKGQKMLDGKSVRTYFLMDALKNEYLRNLKSEEVELFDLLVHLVFFANREPERIILNLLKVINSEMVFDLEPTTISESAYFLDEGFRKDMVLSHLRRAKKENIKK